MKEKLKYYTVKMLWGLGFTWFWLCQITGILTLTIIICGGFKVEVGKRVFKFDGLFDILLSPIINWFYKV